MPKIDGKKTADIIRSNPKIKSIPIVALSASAFTGNDKDIIDVGFDAFVRKPASLSDIIEVMMRFLSHTIIEDITTKKETSELNALHIPTKISEDFKKTFRPLILELGDIKPKKKVLYLANALISFGERNNEDSIVNFGKDLKIANLDFSVERENELLQIIAKLLK